MAGKTRTYQGIALPAGVRIRGNSVQIFFSWCGEQQQITLKELEVSVKDIEFAGVKVQHIKQLIQRDQFEWVDHFPDHKYARTQLELPADTLISKLLVNYIAAAENELAGVSWDNYSYYIHNFLIPAFGGIPVADFTAGHARQWVKENHHLSRSTLNSYLAPLRSALREAVLDGQIKDNVLDRFVWPKESKKVKEAKRQKKEENGDDVDPLHTINHPHTKHYCESVWDVDPVEACNGRPVGLAWFSPDCKHFSKAKGGKPKSKEIRGLAWVAVRWAKRVRPRVIMLENVEEFQDWGPLLEDGTACPARKGETFRQFVGQLQSYGYQVQWKELRACDYGSPTIRKRLFLIARCDGQPIVWPTATYGHGLMPYKTAADCIDWNIPWPSIFERKRPLAENTLRRIAKGIQKFVVDNPKPFIVPIAHYNGRDLAQSIEQPLRTITAYPKGGSFSLVTAFITKYYGTNIGLKADSPLHTVTSTGNKFGLMNAFIAKHYTGVTGSSMKEPLHTITSKDHNALVTAQLQKRTNHSEKVHAFLVKYYGAGDGQSITDPCHTITSRDRFGLVTVAGAHYSIVDIGMRMLTPRELYTANGFPADYIIDHDTNGKRLSKTNQVARCGNAVPPQFSEALVRANLVEQQITKAA